MINIVTNKTVINQARETGRKTVVSQGVGIRNELLSCIADFLEVKYNLLLFGLSVLTVDR